MAGIAACYAPAGLRHWYAVLLPLQQAPAGPWSSTPASDPDRYQGEPRCCLTSGWPRLLLQSGQLLAKVAMADHAAHLEAILKPTLFYCSFRHFTFKFTYHSAQR